LQFLIWNCISRRN